MASQKKTIIEVYPECSTPEWMKRGARCTCNGEGSQVYLVETIGKNMAFLMTLGGRGHGWESFTKLHKAE